jgi:hypothetical protein
MLGAATLDLVEHLRAITKGWRIEPMVCEADPSSLDTHKEAMVNPPKGVSLTNFFADWMTKWKDTKCFIRVKIKGKRLRFIQCDLRGDQLTLAYWVGQGWKQGQLSYKRSGINRRSYDYQQHTVYQLFKIQRVKKGTRNRGRRSPGKPSVIQVDRIELSDPGSTARVATMVAATIVKSLEWDCKSVSDLTRTRRAIVLDGGNFNYNVLRHCKMLIEYMS